MLLNPFSPSSVTSTMFSVFTFVLVAQAQDEPEALAPAPRDIKQAILEGGYQKARRLLDRELSKEGKSSDYMLFLKGLVFRYANKPAEAVDTFLKLEESFPESVWIYKARFHRAEAHRALRQFEKAEEIYESEAKRLMGPERKGKLAQVYIKFADKLSEPRDKSKPDAPPPDYSRAYKLYKKVLDLEVSRPLRDRAMYRMAFCMQEAEDWNRAVPDYGAYLKKFDPAQDCTAEAINHPGRNIFQARYNLAQCLLKKNQKAKARRKFEDLVSAIGQALQSAGVWSKAKPSKELESEEKLTDLRSDALYSISKTYNIGNVAETLFAVSALEKYLKEYPSGEKAPLAAFEICTSYTALNRDEEALKAIGRFLAGKDYRVKGEKAAEDAARLKMKALYKKGEVLFKQEKFDEAVKAWKQYTVKYPTGDDWTNAQQRIIDAEYRRGSVHVREKRYSEARKVWSAFLKDYPLDSRSRKIFFALGQICVEEAHEVEKSEEKKSPSEKEAALKKRKELYLKAVVQWRKLVRKYPRTNEASMAQYNIARLYETKLRDLEKAISAYREVTWGPYKSKAKERLQLMTSKELLLVTERVRRTNEKAVVKAQIRNIEELKVDLYSINLEGYFRKHRTIRNIEDLDLDLIRADKTLDFEVEDYEKYKFIEEEIVLPVEAPGVYAVSVSAGKLRAATLVIQSDIEIIVKSSRREVFVFAEDMLKQKGAEGVKVLVSLSGRDGSTEGTAIIEGLTGKDGVFRYKPDRSSGKYLPHGSLSVFAALKGHCASNLLNLRGLGVSKGLSPRGYIYTDRPVYRPGQKVHLRAILREVKKGSYTFTEGRSYSVEVADSQGRVFYKQRIPLGPFGTLHDSIELDRFAAPGKYTIRCFASEGTVFSGSFRVEQYKLEKIKLVFDLPREVYYRGEEVTGSLKALYYYGEPVRNSALRYVLPDGRILTAKTDANGEAEFSFSTSSFPHEGPLHIRASLTEEGVSAAKTIFLSIHGFTAGISTLRNLYIAGEKFDVTVSPKPLKILSPFSRKAHTESQSSVLSPAALSGTRAQQNKFLLLS